jgi:methionyl-tRNA formyltransferase
VKRFALDHGIAVRQPASLKSEQEIDSVRAARADALVVAAYGLLLPQALLDVAPHGALNIHASLLPRWRGAAPLQPAHHARDAETGISIMQMDAGLDTGPLLMQERVRVAPDEDAGTLHDKLASAGAQVIVMALAEIAAGRARAVAQPATGATYAAKIDKDEARLDWSRPATDLERAVRAFRPAPGAFTLLEAAPLKIWRASVVDGKGGPGTVLEAQEHIVVACGEKALAVFELQRAGGRRLHASEFLRGHPLAPGARLS